jgi:type I restriction enzyme S subunit
MNELSYKKTEIGLVYQDWTPYFLGDKIKLLTDYHANGSYEILKKNVTLLDNPDYSIMVRTTNLENNDFINNLKYVNKHAYEFLSKSKVYSDDILMNKIASAGSVYIMPDLGRPVSLAMNLFLIRMNDSVNKKYIYYYLKYIEKFIKKLCSGTATNTITKNEVRSIPLYLPNIFEQNKIASILSTVDNLIKNTDNLINSYTLLKKGLMQTLLTKGIGHTDFKKTEIGEIPINWKILKIKDVTKLIKIIILK